MQPTRLSWAAVGLAAVLTFACQVTVNPQSDPPATGDRAPTVRLVDASATAGTELVLIAEGYDPDGDELVYSWSGTFSADGNPARWTPTSEGAFSVTVTVSDGTMSASDSAIVTVAPKPWAPESGHVYFLDSANTIEKDYCAADLGYSYSELWHLAWLVVDNHNTTYPDDQWHMVGGGEIT